ncbi:hypothetical protein [Streptomyces sp. NBC_00239]|uniref:hypothetical protein n=1 Tax=Streptomyces sp. NBC_00239 TaxID=2903640 RepID=UPI002E2A70C0|nr:hypothetical protein [Streptomyces sp. NBC_00239]
MTLEEHARAIEAAIQAAADDGFHLDNGNGTAPARLELNEVDRIGDPVTWMRLDLPDNPI